MRVETVKVVKVKEEYLNSMEGQKRLVNIINGHIKSEDILEYNVSDYVITEIFMEDYYMKNYWNDKEYSKDRMVHALLFGLKDFNYTYSPWETELGILNPTVEQIAERAAEMWGLDHEDKEEIEMIASNFTNHDNLGLRYMSVKDIEKVLTDMENSEVTHIARNIEKQLNSMGISFEEINEEDIKFMDLLKEFVKKAAEDGVGVVYAFE